MGYMCRVPGIRRYDDEMNGTPSELKHIARQTLQWVAKARLQGSIVGIYVSPTDLRKIELCALATLNMAMLYEVYGENPEHIIQILLNELADAEYRRDAMSEEREDYPNFF